MPRGVFVIETPRMIMSRSINATTKTKLTPARAYQPATIMSATEPRTANATKLLDPFAVSPSFSLTWGLGAELTGDGGLWRAAFIMVAVCRLEGRRGIFRDSPRSLRG